MMKGAEGPGLFDEPAGGSEQDPLAARMRPRSLDDFVGQEELLGAGRLLRQAIESDSISSLILWGPPGTGKTSLASIIARRTSSRFETLNAVMAGVADIRKVVAAARHRRQAGGQRTILLVDEIHRFNRSQQDALLPHVEDGTVTLIGATTENPFFEVNATLVSRSRLFPFRPLERKDLLRLLHRALEDEERGLGRTGVAVAEEALHHLADVAGGDGRRALSALEFAVTTAAAAAGEGPPARVGLKEAEESMQQRAVLYDRDGDAHYDTISAFIKSVRGSDPDAALYWLARMINAGEDPRFVLRRLLILAGEDIGLAEPTGIVVAAAAAEAFDRIGMPEGIFPIVEATLYLATAPKSNSALSYFKALERVKSEGAGEVPDHLKDASRDGKALGHGKGYRYPHDHPGHHVSQSYLPAALDGTRFYEPSDSGYEAKVANRLERWRRAQSKARQEKKET